MKRTLDWIILLFMGLSTTLLPRPLQPSHNRAHLRLLGRSRAEIRDTSGPTKNSDVTAQAVINFANHVPDIPLTPYDISIAHRLKRNRQDSLPAPIIVKFTNRRARNMLIQARKTLSTTEGGICINEYLSPVKTFIVKPDVS